MALLCYVAVVNAFEVLGKEEENEYAVQETVVDFSRKLEGSFVGGSYAPAPKPEPSVVWATMVVSGIAESALVANQTTQGKFIKAFSSATKIPENTITISKHGTRQILTGELLIIFAINAISPDDAENLVKKVTSTSIENINKATVNAGIVGVKVTKLEASTKEPKADLPATKKKKWWETTAFIAGVTGGGAGYLCLMVLLYCSFKPAPSSPASPPQVRAVPAANVQQHLEQSNPGAQHWSDNLKQTRNGNQ